MTGHVNQKDGNIFEKKTHDVFVLGVTYRRMFAEEAIPIGFAALSTARGS
jgi:hypothetical protein